MKHIEKLEYLVNKTKPRDIADKLGLTTTSILNKRKGNTPITMSEGIIIDILYTNRKRAEEIIAKAQEEARKLTQ
jgi:hypothetical protein